MHYVENKIQEAEVKWLNVKNNFKDIIIKEINLDTVKDIIIKTNLS